MTIASALADLNTDIQNARTAITNKGGTVTVDGGSSQLATDIGTITTMNGITLSITPTTSAQSFTPQSPYNAFTNVSISAVTYTIDPNIVASNIKSGVSILGVTGNVVELNGETRTETLTSSAGQTFTPTTGKNAITSITVTPNNQARSVTPTTSAQTINVGSGYSGNGTISVSAVTSSIDPNIQPQNIKEGVIILNTVGTYQGGITPSGTISITANATYDVTNYANAQVNVPNGNTTIWGATIEDILPNTNYTNTQPTNHEVVMNVTSSSMTNNGTTYRYSNLFRNSGIRKFTCNTSNANYNYWMYEICRDSKYLEEINFPNLTQITGQYAFEAAWRMNISAYRGKVKKILFPNLTTASGYYCFRYAFIGTLDDGAVVDFGKLTTVGQYGFYQGFSNSYGVCEEISFPLVTSVSSNSFFQAFMGSPVYVGGPKKFKMDSLVNCGSTYCFYNLFNVSQSIEEVSFDKLASLSGQYTFASPFNGCPKLKKVNFRSLATVNGTNCMNNLFSNCTSMPITYCFESLQQIGTSYASMKQSFAGTTPTQNLFLPSAVTIGCNNTTATNATFYGCIFQRLYLPKWTTANGTGASNIFSACNNLTEFHFGKENQSTIEAMAGYSSLWGRGAGSATVYFDLINHITVGGVVYDRDGPDYQIDYDGGTSYYSWKNGSTIIYTTEPYTPAVNDSVYTKSGDTYTVSGTITAVA